MIDPDVISVFCKWKSIFSGTLVVEDAFFSPVDIVGIFVTFKGRSYLCSCLTIQFCSVCLVYIFVFCGGSIFPFYYFGSALYLEVMSGPPLFAQDCLGYGFVSIFCDSLWTFDTVHFCEEWDVDWLVGYNFFNTLYIVDSSFYFNYDSEFCFG